jgi:hypothetical protein
MRAFPSATHCHLALGIFTQVSTQRECSSNALPDESVPLPKKSPVAMAVSPKTVTRTSRISTLVYLVALASAKTSVLFIVFPSQLMSTSLSERSGANISGLLVFCDSVHLFSKAIIDFSTAPPVCGVCAYIAPEHAINPSKQNVCANFTDSPNILD